eukprot:1911081-Pleurochrysis_carterae.AAC.1
MAAGMGFHPVRIRPMRVHALEGHDLFTLYSHDGDGSLYQRFTADLASRWNVEDEGPVSDLLSVDISTESDCVTLRQEKYITHL